MVALLLVVGCVETALSTLGGDQGAADDTAAPVNLPPSAPSVAVSPSDPGSDDNLLCQLTAPSIDPEGAELTTSFSWERDGEPSAEGPLVPADYTAAGELWTCIAVATDGQLESDPGTDTVQVTQANRPPGSPVVEISPSSPGANHPLSCRITEPATDPDGDEVLYAYAWSVDGAPSDETSDTVSSADTRQGEEWTCTVAATDGALAGGSGSDTVTIDVEAYGEDITSGLVYDASSCSYCPDNDWYIPDKAFDDRLGTGTESWDAFWTDGVPQWISVDFGAGNERAITRYGLMGAAFHEGYRARDWTLQASDDEATWVTLHTVTDADLAYVMYGGEPFTYYALFNERKYRYYRIHVTANMGGQPYNNAVNIVEIEMMEDAPAE
jgi:hypothetical protein